MEKCKLLKNVTALFLLLLGCYTVTFCADAGDDLLKFLIGQNEAAKEKIKTAEYKVQWTGDTETKEGLRHDEGFGEVKMKGDWRFSTQECNASIPATGWQQKQTQSMVINDKYLAYWPTFGNAYIYQDDHQSLKDLSDDAKLRRNLHTTPDIFAINVTFGGERDTTFKEMMKLHPDEIRWTAEESKEPNGDTVYLIKRYSPFMNDSAKPDGVWTIDPQKGFIVTQAIFYSKAGNTWVTRKTESKEIGSGIWVPTSYQEQRYGKPSDPKASQEPNSSITIQFEDVSINNEIPDNFFVIESILPEEYKESTTLFRKGLDGNTEAYIYRNGGYILRKDWQNLDHTTTKALEDLNTNIDAVNNQETSRQSKSQLMEERPATTEEIPELSSSKELHIPLAAKENDMSLAYILFGLLGVALAIFLLKFGKQILK